MIQIHHAEGWEISDAEALWGNAFGDEPEFQQSFYRLCAPEGPLVLSEERLVRSMLALPELALILADGTRLRAGYVYALATDPSCRRQCWATILLEVAAGLGGSRGLDCLLTVPARPGLFPFFERNGFQPGCYLREVEAEPVPAPVEELSPEGYAALREELLAGRTHTAYTAEQLAFQRAMCPEPGSGLYRLELAHGPGCAAVENWDRAPVVKELLCAPGDQDQGAAACAALCGRPVKVRVPAGRLEGRPFACIRWTEGTPDSIRAGAGEGWLGLAFD